MEVQLDNEALALNAAASSDSFDALSVPCQTGVPTSPGSSSSAFLPFLGEGSPTRIDYRKGYPYSNLSTGVPTSHKVVMGMPPMLVSTERGAAQK